MAKFEVTGPDGARYEVTAPEGASEQDAISYIQRSVTKKQPTTAETVADVGEQSVRGFNKGLVGLVTAPYRALDWLGEKATGGDFLPNAEDMPLYKPFLQQPKPATTAGKYAQSAGEAVGSSAIPTAGLVTAAPRMAALAPTSTARAVAQSVGAPIAARPGAAVAADAVASAGAGTAHQGASDAGFGPTGQLIAGIAGAAAPLAAGSAVTRGIEAIQSARASANPYARVVKGLGDQSLDDVADSLAVGTTRFDQAINRRVLDTLGEEMVRAGGNRQAAVAATLARLEREGGVAPATAQDQLRRVVNAQRDNTLLLGEYPAVAGSNAATRLSRNAANVSDEAASATTNPGTQRLIDYVANTGSMASSQNVRNAIGQRAEGLTQSTRDAVQSMSPGGRTIQDVEALVDNLTRQARREYDVAHNGPVNYNVLHGLLQRVLERHLRRVAGRGDDQATALREAVERFYTERPVGVATREAMPLVEDQLAATRMAIREARRQREPKALIDDLSRRADALAERLRLDRREVNPGTQQVVMPTLQQAQDMRGGVRGQIRAARQAGRDDIAGLLQPLYDDVSRIMRRASPEWGRANDRWADMNLREVAAELGDALSKTAGPRFRTQMREFNQLAPEAQDVVRVHFTQQLLDKIENAAKLGGMKNLGELFASEHTRNMVRTILGDDAAVRLARLIRDANVMARSRDMLKGSPTQPRQQMQKEQDADLNLLASAQNVDWREWKKAIFDHAVAFMRERRNKVVGRVITTPVSDTPAIAEHLERMRAAQARLGRSQMTTPLNPLAGVGGYVGSIPPLFEE